MPRPRCQPRRTRDAAIRHAQTSVPSTLRRASHASVNGRWRASRATATRRKPSLAAATHRASPFAPICSKCRMGHTASTHSRASRFAITRYRVCCASASYRASSITTTRSRASSIATTRSKASCISFRWESLLLNR